MKIQVTKEDIEKGEIKDRKCCPIALALRRIGFTNVEVTCEMTIHPTSFLPNNARLFVTEFDVGIPVKPFSFYLGL